MNIILCKNENCICALSSDVIHLWLFDLADGEILSRSLEVLTSEELVKCANYKREQDKNAFAIGHGMLKILTKEYLRLEAKVEMEEDQQTVSNFQTESALPELLYGSHGKPFFKGNPLYFNISHAGEYILIAFSKDREIGVDIEKPRKIKRLEGFLEKMLSPEELADFKESNEEYTEKSVFQKWTQKEALLKGIGVGLDWNMSDFTIEANKAQSDRYPQEAEQWGVTSVEGQEPYYISLAYKVK